MSALPPETKGDVSATIGGVHRFGTASESLFRRLYRGLSRRQQLEEELRQQGQLLQGQASQRETIQRNYQQLSREHRQRGTELERLHAVLGSLDEGIIVQDPNGKVTMMNQTAEVMLGGRKAFWDSAIGSMAEQYRDVQETAAELTPLGDSGEMPLNHRIVRAQFIAIGDDSKRRIGTVIILRDVTHDAIAARLKDGFVTHAAREMERPISVIKLATELLSGQPEDTAVNQMLLDKLLRNVDMLDQLALELLDIASMDAGTYEVERQPLPVEEVIWSVVNGMDADIKDLGIDLLVMARGLSGLRIRGDATRLQWALGHLIRNGALYNRERGYVAAAARVEMRNGKAYAAISVSDNGIGIKQADLPHIFDRFYRGDTSGAGGDFSAPPGLGQGLYVAKAICEVHGGYLQVQSRLNIGSIFTMGLPIFDEPSAKG